METVATLTLAQKIADVRAVTALLAPGRTRKRFERYLAMLDAAPPSAQERIIQAIAIHHHPGLDYLLEGRFDLGSAVGYPGIPPRIAARLVLGERPVDLAPGLTRREAHLWLSQFWDHTAPTARSWARPIPPPPGGHNILAGDSAAHWYCWHHGLPVRVRKLPVALWLEKRWANPAQREALERQRREVFAGQLVAGRFIDRLDELEPRDLCKSVEGTFARAGQRLARALERSMQSSGKPLHAIPKWWEPVRCARLLNTGEDLVREGRAMKHCVSVYAPAIASGESVIVGMHVLGLRSTVELDPRLVAVRQHKGRSNSAPPELCARALEVCLGRWRRNVILSSSVADSGGTRMPEYLQRVQQWIDDQEARREAAR